MMIQCKRVGESADRQFMGYVVGGLAALMAVTSLPALGQVVYQDGAVHLLDEDHPAPNGDLMEGVLVENDTTLAIRDINANGQPTIGGVGFTVATDDGDVRDLIVAAFDEAVVNIDGGTFSGSLFEPDVSRGALKLTTFEESRLNIRSGRFTTPRNNSLEANGDSTIRVTGGTFVSTDQSNNLLAADTSRFIVDGGEFVTQGPADDSNSFNALGSFNKSTITVAGGEFRPSGQNHLFQSGESTLNITGGRFIADAGLNFVISNSGTTNITGGEFSAAGGLPVYGSIANLLLADYATLNVSGGVFTGETLLNARFTGVMNFHGGSFPSDTTVQLGERIETSPFFDHEDPRVHLFGTGFALDGVALDFADSGTFVLFDFDGANDTVGLLDGDDVLTGVFADGNPFSLNIEALSLNDRDRGGRIVLHIPEPASMGLMAVVAGSLMLPRARMNER